MSNSGWIVAVTLGLALFAMIGWGVFATGLKLGETKAENAYHTSRYAAHAADQINRTCVAADPADMAECIAKIVNTTNENQRAQDDLEAQSKMALWAFWMLVATVFMAVVTAMGVFFVWRTLESAVETAKAAHNANKIMQAEQRPWLEVKVWPRCDVSCFEKQSRIDFSYTITHKGGRPALNVLVDKSIGFGPDFIDLPWDEERDFLEETISGKYNRLSDLTLFPGDEETRHTSVSRDQGGDFKRALISICVTYDAGGERGHDGHIYVVNLSDAPKIGPRRNIATDMPLLRKIG